MIFPNSRLKWILLIVTAVSLGIALRATFAKPAIEDGTYLSIRVAPEYAVSAPGDAFSQLIEERRVLVNLLSKLERAQSDERIDGVVLRIPRVDMGWARLREIRNALIALREAGKTVVAYLDSSALGGNREYYLAVAADNVYVPPAGTPMLTGLAARYVFLGGLWDHLNLGVQVEQIREYKGFGDQIGGTGMTDALREQANSILDDLNAEFLGAIADGRGIGIGEVEQIVEACPATADDFIEAGLADGERFMDEILEELGGGERAPTISLAEYDDHSFGSLFGGAENKIAVIYASGSIVHGRGGDGGLGGDSVGSGPLVKAFREAAEDDEIAAIVFRINSPGGSPLGSDHVWHAVQKAAEKKPVIASLSDVAASGGYYMASGADRIVADPTTITGSIGVVLVRPNLSGVYERFDVGIESISRGRYSGILDTSRPMTEDELALIREQMDSTYRTFLDRVAVGRGMTAEEVDLLGGGRVWTGRQALERKLVDEMGGLDAAIELAKSEAGISGAEAGLVYLPERKSTIERLLDTSGARLGRFMPRDLRAPFEALSAYAELGDGVQALSAAILEIR